MRATVRRLKRTAARVVNPERARDLVPGARAALRAQVARSGGGPLGDLLNHAISSEMPGEEAWAKRIEAHRNQLLVLDHVEITRATGPRSVAAVCASDSKGAAFGRLLFRLSHLTRARRAIELGTCLGISGSYIAAGLDDHGVLTTLEGNERLASLARIGFELLDLTNVHVACGDFSQTYGDALAQGDVGLLYVDGNHREEPTLRYFEDALPHLTAGATVVFDDVDWSDAMRRAWARLRVHLAAKEAYAFGGMGFVAT